MRPEHALISGLRSDSHTWGLAYLQLWLEERQVPVRNLGPCVALDTLIDACLRDEPPLVMLSTVNGHAELEALEIIAAFRKHGLLERTRVVIGGKLTISPEREPELKARFLDAGFHGVFVGPHAMNEFARFLEDTVFPTRGARVRPYEIRRLQALDEFHAAIGLQKSIWGFSDVDLFPIRVFVTLSRIGGQAFGAFRDGEMLGFCLAYPGLRQDGRSYLHSQILGVRPQDQNAGIGRALKLEQRRDALGRHLEEMEWVFDPLDARSAYFNIEVLGCIIRRYERNRYGPSSSPAHAGLPTDRCVAEWRMASRRVQEAIDRTPKPRPLPIEVVDVPGEIAALKREQPQAAREAQQRVAERLEEAFREGLSVVGFERIGTGGRYVLGQGESQGESQAESQGAIELEAHAGTSRTYSSQTASMAARVNGS